ncbi:MAG: alcohol dehydrogenase [Myxococcaceae bacterium]|nr:alcohol dehydrogenase [Myxococcaceae bacterium]
MARAFEFRTATRIVFGAGKAALVADFLAELGVQRLLVVTGKDARRASAVWQALDAAGLVYERCVVEREPSVELVRAGTRTCIELAAQAVVAVGGGSAIDAGKAIAALATNGGDPLAHLEVVGRGLPLRARPLPFAALPTTAGTGAEVTRNAVLSSPEHGVKASLRSPWMLPDLAIVDPDFLCAAPREVLRASGLDALSQLIEPFVSVQANPLSDGLAREGLARSRRALEPAVLHGPDAGQREDLALASLFGGLCLANAGLGAVHGFAAPVGGMFEAPHGAVCAALLPHVMRVNLRALRARSGAEAGAVAMLQRYRELAQVLTGAAHADAEQAITWVEQLCRSLEVPGLSAYGMQPSHIPELVDKAKRASSMRGNSLALNDEELWEIASSAL